MWSMIHDIAPPSEEDVDESEDGRKWWVIVRARARMELSMCLLQQDSRVRVDELVRRRSLQFELWGSSVSDVYE